MLLAEGGGGGGGGNKARHHMTHKVETLRLDTDYIYTL